MFQLPGNINCDFHITYGGWEEKVGGGGSILYYFDTLSAPVPTFTFILQFPRLPVCTTVKYLKTGEDQGVHMSKAKHVTQSKENPPTMSLVLTIHPKVSGGNVLYQPVFQWSV